MALNLKKIDDSTSIPDNYKYYWKYQYRLGEEILVPYLNKLGAFKESFAVAEIGAAEGGVLAAFTDNGAKKPLGTDIVQHRLDMGNKIKELMDYDLELVNHDIIYEELPEEWKNAYDLVLLRDVIEHLDDTEIALKNIKKIIKPGGYLFVTFPPYHSPFGGHQHTVANRGGKVPYIHLLPDPIFHSFIKSGRDVDIEEVKRLQKIRLTPNKFMDAVKSSGYSLVKEDYYLLRPVFKMKFGLPSLKITRLKWIPAVKNLLSLEAAYLLKA